MGQCWTKSSRCQGREDEDENQRCQFPELASGDVHFISSMQDWEAKLAEASRDMKIVVANFSASWCAPCRTIAPVFRELSEKYPSIVFITVDVDELAEFSNSMEITATPTFFFLNDGQQIDKLVGANKTELLRKTAAASNLVNRSSCRST